MKELVQFLTKRRGGKFIRTGVLVGTKLASLGKASPGVVISYSLCHTGKDEFDVARALDMARNRLQTNDIFPFQDDIYIARCGERIPHSLTSPKRAMRMVAKTTESGKVINVTERQAVLREFADRCARYFKVDQERQLQDVDHSERDAKLAEITA